MEISITFPEHSALQESFKVENLLGEGKFKVYSVYSHKLQTKYALKIFPNDTLGKTHFQKEQILTHFDHPNIIKAFPVTHQNKDYQVLLTEFAPFGDIFDLTANGVFHSEALIRTYFRQLIKGIEYLHSQEIAHLDLKLENLVLGSDYKLKIIDFDQAQSFQDKQLKSGGSVNCRAPEIITKKCKDYAAADVYSAGIILYTLVAKKFPFKETTDLKGTRMQYYSTFRKDKTKFWAMKAESLKDKDLFSEDLIELLNEMFEYDVEKRIKLQEIKESKWYQGPVISEERLSEQLKSLLSKGK